VHTRLIQIAMTAAAILAGAAFLYLVNPVEYVWLPPCMFHKLTGLNCPGCGMTRATHQLLHGHLLTALHMNALLTIAVPGIVGVGIWHLVARPERRPSWKPIYTWLVIGVLVVFGFVRNIPAYPFTLLVP